MECPTVTTAKLKQACLFNDKKESVKDDISNKDKSEDDGITDGCNNDDCDNTATGKDIFDDLFSSLIGEIDNLPKPSKTTKIKSLLSDNLKVLSNVLTVFGTPDEECFRLTSHYFASSFDVLHLGPEATDEEIKQQFRKLSLRIHPDKCRNEKAKEAFNIVNKAYEELQLPESKEKYKKVINHAKKIVLKELKKQNSIRRARGEPQMPETEEAMKVAVAEKCEELLKLHEEQKEYADKTRKANEFREKKMEEEAKTEAQKKQEEKKEWEAHRDGRVDEWRSFQSVHGKMKNSIQPVKCQKEQRAPHQGEVDNAATAAKKEKSWDR